MFSGEDSVKTGFMFVFGLFLGAEGRFWPWVSARKARGRDSVNQRRP